MECPEVCKKVSGDNVRKLDWQILLNWEDREPPVGCSFFPNSFVSADDFFKNVQQLLDYLLGACYGLIGGGIRQMIDSAQYLGKREDLCEQ